MSLEDMRRELRERFERLKGRYNPPSFFWNFPIPEIVTHSTEISTGLKILDTGKLIPFKPGGFRETIPRISFSLDTSIWFSEGTVFVFDLNKVLPQLKPMFCLFTPFGSTPYFEEGMPYAVTSWMTFPWAEVYSERKVSLRDLKYVVSPDRGTRTTAEKYNYSVREEVETTSFTRMIDNKKMIIFKAPPDNVPTKEIGEVIHGYNEMLARVFGISYSEVLSYARRVVSSNPDYGLVWW